MDLIDRNELLKHQHNIIEWDGLIQAIFLPVVDLADIKNAPTVEAEPVKHGKWIWKRFFITKHCTIPKVVCSVCNITNKQYTSPYCPHCGAKMDLEGEENA